MYQILIELITNAKIGDALTRASENLFNRDFIDELYVLKARFEKNEKENRANIISKDQYDLEFNKITTSLLAILNENKQVLTNSYNEFIPEISFDSEFNIHQNLDELITFLNEFDYNYKLSKNPICKISFPLENVLLFELNKGAKNSEIAAIQNVLEKIANHKLMIIELIRILISEHIHYNLKDDKGHQAIVLRSLIYRLKQGGFFTEIYHYTYKTGIKLAELILWDTIKEDKSVVEKKDIFFFGSVPENYTKLEIHNNNANPKIIHPVWLNNEETNEFEENLCKDPLFGKSAKSMMMQLGSTNTFLAIMLLPQNVIFEKLIPEAISKTYFDSLRYEVEQEWVKKSLNIDSLSVGYG